VFDLPSDLVETIKSQWTDGRFDTLVVATDLPALQEQEFNGGSGGRGGGHGGRFQRGGGGGGGYARGGNRAGFTRDGMMKRNYGGGDVQCKRTTFE